MERIPSLLVGLLLGMTPMTWAESYDEQFQQVLELKRQENRDEAFMACLGVPGAEFTAIALGRSKAGDFLKLLESPPDDALGPMVKVVRGDLLLALGRKDEALAEYRRVAAELEAAEAKSESLLHDYYPVEPEVSSMWGGRDLPFRVGPGSHRDNLLLRRFIAMEAWDEAATEFRRVWAMHQRRTEPYVLAQPVMNTATGAETRWLLVTPAGHDGMGLQFAIDYAFFLKKREMGDESLALLLEVLRQVDMDRNPNVINPVMAKPLSAKKAATYRKAPARVGMKYGQMFEGSNGVSRKEFVRLVFGEFRNAGKEEELVTAVEGWIADGQVSALRLLARIRLHQGRADDALALEITYIDQMDFSAATTAYRCGLVNEELQQYEEAVRHYEGLLAMPVGESLSLPDIDEDAMEQQQLWWGQFQVQVGMAGARKDAARRLTRLRASQGDTDKLLQGVLVELETSRCDLNALEAAAKRFEAVERSAEFTDWMRNRLKVVKIPEEQAALFWMLGEWEQCAKVLVASVQGMEDYRSRLWGWELNFRKEGHGAVLLRELHEMFPDDATIRIELMELEERFAGADAIRGLEDLLEGRAKIDFERREGQYHALKFRSHYDLAYRLMRMYEKVGRLDDLRALGMRMARKNAPFDMKLRDGSYIDSNGHEEDINACHALLVHHADTATMAELDQLWSKGEEHAGLRQLRRRQSGSFASQQVGPDIGWANAPDGVRMVASTLTVLDMVCDDEYVYAGHPWGVSVFKHDGTPVTRIALGEAVLTITVGNGYVWAGTLHGLFRIRIGDWAVGHLWLDGDLPEQMRKPRPLPGELGECSHDNRVIALTVDDDELWIATQRNIQRLDMKTLSLRAYSADELQAEGYEDFSRMVLDGDYLWVESRAGLRRYEQKTDRWKKVVHGKSPVRWIGMVDGRLYGECYVDEMRRSRPCLVDRKSLEVEPVVIAGDDEGGTGKPRMINGPYSILGVNDGRVVMGEASGHRERFAYDEGIGQLVSLGTSYGKKAAEFESIVPAEWRENGVTWDQPVTSELLSGRSFESLSVPLIVRGLGWIRWIQPSGVGIVARHGRVMEYRGPSRDWPYDDSMYQRKIGEDGIYECAADGSISDSFGYRFSDTIDGNVVFTVVPDEASERMWVCTDLGVALLDADDRVTAVMTMADGLPANRIPGGAMVGGKPVFAAGWGSYGGGLVVAETTTKVLNGFYQSDGLSSDKLAQVEESGGMAKVSYDIERDPYEYNRERICDDSLFDILTGTHVSGGAPGYDTSAWYDRYQQKTGEDPPVCPLLGGILIKQVEHAGKTYICGTRGLLVVEGRARPVLKIDELEAKLQIDSRIAQQEEALRMVDSRSVKNMTTLRRFLESENPYIRGRALGYSNKLFNANPEAFLPLLWELCKDPHSPVRLQALKMMKWIDDEKSVPHLLPLLKDEEQKVRDEAAIALARLGTRPEIGIFDEMLQRTNDYSRTCEIQRAIGWNADADVFRLMLKFPVGADDNETRQRVFEALGGALRKHPEHVEILLHARSAEGDHGPKSNYGSVRFVQEVFRHTGESVLPLLHEALTSDDRVVRSNAARGCGAIKHPSSIPLLVKAMDLESGLSRASIVWALGELQAVKALPLLIQQFTDARNDEKRRRGAGFRASQSAQVIGSHYDSLRSVDQVQGDWAKLKEQNGGQEIDPRQHEWLLSSKIVLDAIRAVGAKHSQEFYRMLAGEEEYYGRGEAAEALAQGTGADREKNVVVLRNLLGDRDAMIQISAGISLLMLDEPSAQRVILEWLKPENEEYVLQTLQHLERVEDPADLEFARSHLEELATLPPPTGNYSLNFYAKRVIEKMKK